MLEKFGIKCHLEYPGDAFFLPNDIVDKHLRLAGPLQIKVLLWVFRWGKRVFDPEECGAAIGQSAAVCADAIQYWLETGILERETAAPEVLEEKQPAKVHKPAREKEKPVQGADALNARAATKKPVERPAAVKPQMQEVLKEERSSPAFAYLLQTASARMGKAISPADMQTLLYLYRDVALPAEVILMVIEYVMEKKEKKHTIRYVESVALNWVEQGIDTMAAVEQHLLQEKRREQAWTTVRDLLGLELSGTFGQKETAEKWIFQWQTDERLIKMAGDECREKTNKINIGYMDKVLEHWRLDGLDTPDKVRAYQEKSAGGGAKKRAAKNLAKSTSFDLEAYTEMVKNYRPVFKKQGE